MSIVSSLSAGAGSGVAVGSGSGGVVAVGSGTAVAVGSGVAVGSSWPQATAKAMRETTTSNRDSAPSPAGVLRRAGLFLRLLVIASSAGIAFHSVRARESVWPSAWPLG